MTCRGFDENISEDDNFDDGVGDDNDDDFDDINEYVDNEDAISHLLQC